MLGHPLLWGFTAVLNVCDLWIISLTAEWWAHSFTDWWAAAVASLKLLMLFLLDSKLTEFSFYSSAHTSWWSVTQMHLINWLLPTQQKQKETIKFCFLLLQQIWPFASYSKSSGGYSLPHTETFYPGGKYMQNTQTHALILNVKACVKIKPLVKWLSLSSCERSKKNKQKKQNKGNTFIKCISAVAAKNKRHCGNQGR